MKISVNWDDIKQGVRYEAKSCPVARAIKRQGYDKTSVGVTIMHASSHLKDGEKDMFLTANLPREATRFIVDFDKGCAVEPFTFEVDPQLTVTPRLNY